jgi:NAD-dependent SIR2 family protein deacetylase
VTLPLDLVLRVDSQLTNEPVLLHFSLCHWWSINHQQSVSAGIPDFRTPKTGLYDNLQKYNLPYAEAVFDIQFFRKNPAPFVMLASEIWPATDRYFPTYTHAFVKVLQDKKKLLRIYTQNIDGLERAAGVTEHSLIECHGHFRSGRCINCKTEVADMEEIKKRILIERKVPICSACKKGYVKPDIVFFGENLPAIFETALDIDLPKVDMLLVMGTSLQVPPVANIPKWVECSRRVLLNREHVGGFNKQNDLFHSGNCDDSVMALAKLLGWEDDLLEAHRQGRPLDILNNKADQGSDNKADEGSDNEADQGSDNEADKGSDSGTNKA